MSGRESNLIVSVRYCQEGNTIVRYYNTIVLQVPDDMVAKVDNILFGAGE